ncbi:ankyrin repeat domain-containing protein 22 [Takifugu rubripes]|uniref:Ankyrin repeat domain 22 n=1 Tax=Takifugu rubripes TaxID=31033 RepID=H2S240_TAKRU|nr:ankyrin repeat domain-containing protein 22 [Takifugu rubripes]
MGLSYSQPACRSAYAGDVHQLFTVLSEDPSQLNVQEPDSGDTPLIAACRRGNLRVVQYLLDNGADVHVTNQKQRTALHYVSRRTFSLLDYLVMAVLMPVLLIGYFIMLQKQRQTVSLMQMLLSSDANVNAVDHKGNTALHYVCERKSHRLVPLLLQKHADTHIPNHAGETPLDIATRLRFSNIVKMLKKTH